MKEENGNSEGSNEQVPLASKLTLVQSLISDPRSCVIQRHVVGDTANVLVIHENREQTLLTFRIPNDVCTVQDILEQASVPLSPNTMVSLNTNPFITVHFIVEIKPLRLQACSCNQRSSGVFPTAENENKKWASIKQEDGPELLNRKRLRTRRNNHLADQGPYEALECHTISSDEADIDEKKIDIYKAGTSSSTIANLGETVQRKTQRKPFGANSLASSTRQYVKDERRRDDGRDLPFEHENSLENVSLPCRAVIIGTYYFTPKENVTISEIGMKMGVPPINDDTTTLSLLIKANAIRHVRVSFRQARPALFFEVTPNTAESLRKLLGMQDPQGLFFDPTSKDMAAKFIIIMLEVLENEACLRVQNIFAPTNRFSRINGIVSAKILSRILLWNGWPRFRLPQNTVHPTVIEIEIKSDDESNPDVENENSVGPEIKTEIKSEPPSWSTEQIPSHLPSLNSSSTEPSQIIEPTDAGPLVESFIPQNETEPLL